MRLAGRTALVTGGARGIGLAIARLFLVEGAAVTIGDVDAAAAERAVAATPGLRFVTLDVTNAAAWDAAIARTPDLDLLVNNAGIIVREPVTELTTLSLDRLFDVNVKGVALGMRAGLRAMCEGRRSGSILNLSSIAAYMTSPGYMAYTASKSAVERMTKVAANEAGRFPSKVRVNCLHPGNIDTDMTDRILGDLVAAGALDPNADGRAVLAAGCALGRNGTAHEVALAALFLCSEEAAFITGAGLAIDGGMGLM